ncbi:MAG TPA: hypothetical protein VKH18_16075 [Terriglobales bacterium]|nr:hypothetical protein [Terriglobales bacterium]
MFVCHPFPGFTGLILGPLIFGVIGAAFYFTKEHEFYNMDPKGIPGAFESLLVKYIKAAEYTITIATGSIILLVGSSALRVQGGGHLPWFFASPLLLLGWSVIFGVVFMAWQINRYESYQHGNDHTKLAYTISEAFGSSSLACFCSGYMLLIFLVTR